MRRLAAFKQLAKEVGLVAYWRATGQWGDFARPLGSDDFECLYVLSVWLFADHWRNLGQH